MEHRFLRTEMVLGDRALDRLSRCHVAVFGLGGVGSYAAEILARSGVGELTLVDQDTLSLTNINRQLYALSSTVGEYKAEAAARRCRDINPGLRLHPLCATYDAAHRDAFFTGKFDYIADCIDLVTCKLDLIAQAGQRGIPIISALGTGNKLDPGLLQITDISRTSVCPLARVMRRELRDRGIRVEELPEGFRVPGGQQYGRGTLGEEADYSQAAFWLAAAGLGSPLTVEGLDPDSTQGDRCVVPYFQQLAGPGRVELDIAQCPDLAPALAVRAALRPGQTARLVNAGRLRLKECDRLAAIPEELNKLGGQLTEGTDFLEIRGVERLLGGVADSHNDHRIAMMLAVAATRAEGTVTIRGAESVAKSYPDFWEVYESLGGRVLRQREEREACDM